MGNKELDLYLGLSKRLTEAEVANVLSIVYYRHPGARREDTLDGYWSGVEETTLLFKVVANVSSLSDTVDAISAMYPSVFIAIDEPDI